MHVIGRFTDFVIGVEEEQGMIVIQGPDMAYEEEEKPLASLELTSMMIDGVVAALLTAKQELEQAKP